MTIKELCSKPHIKLIKSNNNQYLVYNTAAKKYFIVSEFSTHNSHLVDIFYININGKLVNRYNKFIDPELKFYFKLLTQYN